MRRETGSPAWLVYIEEGDVEFVLVCTLHLPGYVNKMAELPFPHMI